MIRKRRGTNRGGSRRERKALPAARMDSFQRKWKRLMAILEPPANRKEEKRLQTLVIHLVEIQESAAKVSGLIGQLLAMKERNKDAVGDLLVDLDVEIRAHFRWHARHLTKPIERYLDRIWPD